MTQLQRWRVPCPAASNKMFGKRVFTEVDSFRIGRDSGAIPKGVAETAVTGCSSPNRCALLQKDFISLEVSSSVWDCRLFRRPAKVLAKNAVFWPGYKKSVWSAEQGP